LVSSFFFVVMAKIINIRKYFKAFKADFNRNQRVSIVGFIVLTIMVVFVNAILLVAFMDMQSSSSIMFLTLIFVMYVAFILGFVRVNRNLSVKTEEYEQLKFYTSIIENLVDASNKFRHDYRNIMLTFDGYLRNNEYDKLRGFYDTIVKSTAESLDNSFYQLKHVKDAGIKGLLTMKMNNAVSAGVNVEFEAKKDVDIAMDTLDLSRILGIFIDNAQEAATDSEQKRLRMGFMVDEDSITFLIANTFSEKPDVNDIYKQGVSSKGKGRGTGLATVREIIDTNYQNVILNTTVEDGYFIQEMIFEK